MPNAVTPVNRWRTAVLIVRYLQDLVSQPQLGGLYEDGTLTSLGAGRIGDLLAMPLDEARIVRTLVGLRRAAMRVEPNTAPHLKP